MAKELLGDFGMIKEKIASRLFGQENDFFLLNNGVILEINSLCGTRTFTKFGYLDGIKRVRPQKADFTIVRDEKERLLSAYNKKIIVNDDWKKSLLRLSTGLKYQMEFTKFMQILIERKDRHLFIDKHFRPSKSTGKPIYISELKTNPILSPCTIQTISRREKSSEEVARSSVFYKTNTSLDENKLIDSYMRLFDA